MPTGFLARDLLGGDRVRHDLAVDARLAHPAGDQLRVLGAEVDDEHGALHRALRRFRHAGTSVLCAADGSIAAMRFST